MTAGWEIVIAVIGALGGIEGVKYLVTRKENKRIARAEASAGELKTLKETTEFLQQQLQEKELRFADQTKRLRETQNALYKETEKRHKSELELSLKRCNDIHCPFREPPTAHTPPKPDLTKEAYQKRKAEKEARKAPMPKREGTDSKGGADAAKGTDK